MYNWKTCCKELIKHCKQQKKNTKKECQTIIIPGGTTKKLPKVQIWKCVSWLLESC